MDIWRYSKRQTKAEQNPHLLFGSFEKKYHDQLRSGIPSLIRELQRQAYDVWIYTNTFHSIEYLQSFFRAYKVSVDGIVNGMEHSSSKNAENEYRKMLAQKYNLIYNIDNEGILCIHPGIKEFDTYDLASSDYDWANKVMEVINKTQRGR